MKYVVLLCDGMADKPIAELDNLTPMQKASKPNMDRLAKDSIVGTVKTVDDGLKPGSDVANLSVMGFDPLVCYTGRSPLEAASIGIDMKDTDIAIRCNLVTLSDNENFDEKVMVDYCADDISTEQADALIKTLQEQLGGGEFDFYTGVAYRHCLIWHNGVRDGYTPTPPHDISGKVIGEYLTEHKKQKKLLDLMKKSEQILKNHPVNLQRIKDGRKPATTCWFWGQGSKPQLDDFYAMHNLKGAVISAVDLLKGIGKCAKMDVIDVEGATGYIDTNFAGKAEAAINALKTNDYVYIHIEAPDECGHRRETENKVRAIELIDSEVLSRVLAALEGEEYRILICPDHPTPISIATHTSDPVPFMIYDSAKKHSGVDTFCEQSAKDTGIYVERGPHLIDIMIKGEV
ncbi:MAG: cofactor-independent phosphoglycerate mutase [Acutalibacteraceae bacterium]|nr:cofactor-independent phosphoglycerate mutase [Acutalibacteraceae bacterium]